MTSDKSLLLLRSSRSPTLIPTDRKRIVNSINYFNLRSSVSCIYNMYYCCIIKYSCRRFPRRYIILCHVFNLYSSFRRYQQSETSLDAVCSFVSVTLIIHILGKTTPTSS